MLTDVEPAVRVNAVLEALPDIETALVSPLDDVAGDVRRFRPDVMVFTGSLLDPFYAQLVRAQLWDGVATVGLADSDDAALRERLLAAGYAELFTKPVVPDDVADAVRRLLDRRRLSQLTGLIGESEPIREVLVKVEQMAPVSSTVLIEGESGTGKELVARAMHMLSPRKTRPFIAVNVGALPETLLESELFGHEKGAFTGAAERRIGRFELADTGTLFLDEIGEIPLTTQVKLLRVLEEREFTRLGGMQSIKVNVRVITATNQPLRQAVEQGSFRADLYYRLNVLSVYLPPLRDRRDDVPILVRRFVAEFTERHDREFLGISADAMQLLVEYPWPGNVRELRNLVESMVVLAPGREIGAADIPPHIRDAGASATARFLPIPSPTTHARDGGMQGRELEFIVRSLVELKMQVEELRHRIDVERTPAAWVGEIRSGSAFGEGDRVGERMLGRAAGALGSVSPAVSASAIAARHEPPVPNTVTVTPGMTMAEIERRSIEAALKETRGNRRRAAELLGIGERTLYRKLREYEADGAVYSAELAPDDGAADEPAAERNT
jgi:DNA-binding NtrC family response regulator